MKHGLYKKKHPLIPRWHGMVMRCTNPNWINYRDYGGRGIKVCERWRKVANFVEDMEKTFFEGAWLDRINTDGDYEPSNCRWTTISENMRNKRNNRLITLNGKTMPAVSWAQELNLNYRMVRVRLWRGWSAERAFSA